MPGASAIESAARGVLMVLLAEPHAGALGLDVGDMP